MRAYKIVHMASVTARRYLPSYLKPDELTAATQRLRSLSMQAWMFWVLWLPAVVLIATLSGLIGLGFFGQVAIGMVAMVTLAAGRFLWWMQQRPVRVQARKDIQRWSRVPKDQRWNAMVILLERVVQISDYDPGLLDTSRRMVALLITLYEDLHSLDQTIAADRVLDGDGEMSERYYRLVAIRTRREAEIDLFLNGLRDLNLEMSEAPNIGPLQDRLTEMMDRLEAEREVARVSGFRKDVLNRARGRNPMKQL